MAPPVATDTSASALLPPVLEQARPSYLEPCAFFVSWQGVLTLAYRYAGSLGSAGGPSAS